jgi:anthranilate synthase/aminodeoxychorismate synthase-like glutamine amidotransferase
MQLMTGETGSCAGSPARGFRRAVPLAERPRTLIIDNYDSFTHNLAQLIGSLGSVPLVFRNDDITAAGIRDLSPDAIVISPGPGNPSSREDFGVSADAIAEFSGRTPLLGVCLGHQGIVQHFGGRIVRASKGVMHGKTSDLDYRREGILEGVQGELTVMRYHSLVAERASLPSCLEILATSMDDGEIMAIRHREHQTFGLQFHPESVLTVRGPQIMAAFLALVAPGREGGERGAD